MTYLYVYRAPSGQWSGKVLEEVAGIGGCENPVDVLQAAREQFPDIEDLPADAPAELDPELTPVSIHHGVDYEVARERLNGIAGRLFTKYMSIKDSGSPEAVEQARLAYIEAQQRFKKLSYREADAIRSILDEPWH